MRLAPPKAAIVWSLLPKRCRRLIANLDSEGAQFDTLRPFTAFYRPGFAWTAAALRRCCRTRRILAYKNVSELDVSVSNCAPYGIKISNQLLSAWDRLRRWPP